jgi:hypothetical protein
VEAFRLYNQACEELAAKDTLTWDELVLFDLCIYQVGELLFNHCAMNFRMEALGLPSVCALCCQRTSLATATSHIFPNFLLKWSNQQFITPQCDKLWAEPLELKCKLLCLACEVSFSALEAYAQDMFFVPFKKIYD